MIAEARQRTARFEVREAAEQHRSGEARHPRRPDGVVAVRPLERPIPRGCVVGEVLRRDEAIGRGLDVCGDVATTEPDVADAADARRR